MASELDIFSTHVQTSYLWVKELKERLGWQDLNRAWLALRSVLHALRDRLVVSEAIDFGAQLPVLIRGVYYDGWNPADKPLRERRLDLFLEHIRRDFPKEEIDAEAIARGVFSLLAEKISGGEVREIKHNLPQAMKELWP